MTPEGTTETFNSFEVIEAAETDAVKTAVERSTVPVPGLVQTKKLS